MSNPEEPRKQVYRESALKHLQTPESTDSLMRVVGPSGWVVAIAIALVFCGAIYWSIFGTVTTFVQGKGILGPAYGETRDFVATHSGILRSLPVQLGDTVEKGELLASIEIVSVAEDKREALRMLEDVAGIMRRVLGPAHPDTFHAQSKLEIYRRRRKFPLKIT